MEPECSSTGMAVLNEGLDKYTILCNINVKYVTDQATLEVASAECPGVGGRPV